MRVIHECLQNIVEVNGFPRLAPAGTNPTLIIASFDKNDDDAIISHSLDNVNVEVLLRNCSLNDNNCNIPHIMFPSFNAPRTTVRMYSPMLVRIR